MPRVRRLRRRACRRRPGRPRGGQSARPGASRPRAPRILSSLHGPARLPSEAAPDGGPGRAPRPGRGCSRLAALPRTRPAGRGGPHLHPVRAASGRGRSRHGYGCRRECRRPGHPSRAGAGVAATPASHVAYREMQPASHPLGTFLQLACAVCDLCSGRHVREPRGWVARTPVGQRDFASAHFEFGSVRCIAPRGARGKVSARRCPAAGWRRGWESNPRIKVLQTSALPLGYRAAGTAQRALVQAGAGDGTRTRDIDLGKVALYQLSYSRR